MRDGETEKTAADRAGGNRHDTQVAVVGGGAAGLLAALAAARRGAQTTLLEGSRHCGLKILVSGGGRCNILPSRSEPGDFFTVGSPNVLKRLFRTWRLEDVHAFFETELGIALKLEPETGKIFPVSNEAREVRDRLIEACREAGVTVSESWRVSGIKQTAEGSFLLSRVDGEELEAEHVILSTGGRSLPKTGSDGLGYDFAREFGHSILPTYPALVPLTTSDRDITELAGLSLPVRWSAHVKGKKVEERVRDFLFTHRGFSGPAILDASHWQVRDDAEIRVSWLDRSPDQWMSVLQAAPGREISSVLAEELPRRLARLLYRRSGLPDRLRLAQLRSEWRDALLTMLCDFPLPVDGNEGYGVAEVTGGGVPLGEVDPRTLESRKTPGLYLCGEILDVIGPIGGYNFLWAWVTGKLAGETAARV